MRSLDGNSRVHLPPGLPGCWGRLSFRTFLPNRLCMCHSTNTNIAYEQCTQHIVRTSCGINAYKHWHTTYKHLSWIAVCRLNQWTRCCWENVCGGVDGLAGGLGWCCVVHFGASITLARWDFVDSARIYACMLCVVCMSRVRVRRRRRQRRNNDVGAVLLSLPPPPPSPPSPNS